MRRFTLKTTKRAGIAGSVSRRKRRADERGAHRTHRLALEPLEDRRMLSTFTVTSSGDNIADDGVMTLREAIVAANAHANDAGGPDRIEFAITQTDENHIYYRNDNNAGSVSLDHVAAVLPDGSLPNPDPDHPYTWFRIQPTTSLPTITDSVVIDGYSQGSATPASGDDARPNTQDVGSNAVLRIELDGSLGSSLFSGLALHCADSTIRGLVVNRFSAYGISIVRFGGNILEGNLIGTDTSGTIACGNDWDGVFVWGASNNRIGTNNDGITDAGERNVISGNGLPGTNSNGVYIWTSPATWGGVTAENNVIAGNYIGTDIHGKAALGDAHSGIRVQGHPGIDVNDSPRFTRIAGNVISGNHQGIWLLWSDDSTIVGNFIGTDATGTIALGNETRGVTVASGSHNVIGTNGDGVADETERNLISGNAEVGVKINNAYDNVVAGNYIGTDVTGTLVLGNDWGVNIAGGARSNRIGTDGNGIADTAERNIISGNRLGIGIVDSDTEGNVVAGNFIGVDVTGTHALSNTHGVWIQGGAHANRIGTNGDGVGDEAERNVISANVSPDLSTPGFGLTIIILSHDNLVAGNYIGTDMTGTQPLGNGYGVAIGLGAQANQIGGPSDVLANKIAFNAGPGVAIVTQFPGLPDFGPSTGNRIQGNSILANTGLGIDLDARMLVPNHFVGDGVTSNDVGDTDAGPNKLENFPVITSFERGSTTRVVGTLESVASTTFTLDFYANTATSPYGIGEGERWLGPVTVSTDATGYIHFDVVLPAATNADDVITATATDPSGNTSEFSYVPERFKVINTNDSGLGSLRSAITGVNLTPGSSIEFAIPSTDPGFVDVDSALTEGDQDADVYLIPFQSPLPALTRDGTVIDARTQGDFGGNTNTFGPEIVLDGSAIDWSHDQSPAVVFVKPASGGLSGSLKIQFHNGDLYVGSNRPDGAIMRFDGSTGDPKPSVGNTGAVFAHGGVNGTAGFGFGADGNLYVAYDSANAVIRFDGVTGDSLGTFVQSGSGGLLGAAGLAFGPDGHVYISSRNNDSVMRYDGQTGAPLPSAGNVGALFATGGGVDEPNGLTFGSDGNLYVASRFNDRVVRYNGTTGGAMGVFVDAGSGLDHPMDVRFDSAGTLTVSSNGNHRVLRYQGPAGTNPGSYLDTVVPSQPDLLYPNGLAYGPDDTLYATSVTSSVLRVTTQSVPTQEAAPNGLQVLSNENQVYGLNIQQFGGNGIQIDGGSNNLVAGCFIGTDATGTLPADNGLHGIHIVGDASSNQIGGAGDLGNTIAFNSLTGVAILGSASTGNRIQGNSIHSNAGLGIDLGADGATANDDGDADTGPNKLQNYPLITSVTVAGGNTTIAGTLNAAPNTDYSSFTLDFYANAVANLTGFGEGERHIGSTDLLNVRTDHDGKVAFEVTFPQAIPDSDVITATATDADGNTSEFSEPKHGAGTAEGVLYIVGTDTDDVVTVTLEGGTQLKVVANFFDTAHYYDAAEVTAIKVYLHHGDDWLNHDVDISTLPSTPTRVEGGTGNDAIQTGSGNDTLLGGEGDDTLLGGAGNDELDGGAGDDHLYGEAGDDTLAGGDGDDWLYMDPATDSVDGEEGNDHYVFTTGSSSSTRIFDTGMSGIDTLAVYGTSGADTLLITPTEVSAIAPAPHPIYYAGIEDVRVDAGDGNDLITIQGSQTPVTILGGAGDDMIVVEGNGPDGLLLEGQDGADVYSVFFGSLAGPVTVTDTGTTGADSLTVYGTSGDNAVIIDGANIASGGETISFTSAVESLSVDTDSGSGNDQVITVVSAPVVPLVVHGSTQAVIEGTDGPDSIQFTPGSDRGEIVATLNGVLLGTFSALTRLTAHGRGGDDEIQVAGSIDVATWLYGGEGNDRLKGGAGHDVLDGGAGDDMLVGKQGRDILVGGRGSDRLVGNGGDDILIAGWLSLGDQEAAMRAIRSEWLSTRDAASVENDYHLRIQNLTDGSGTTERLNDAYFLTIGDGGTVRDDPDDVDILTGSAGDDWFFFEMSKTSRDRATDLKDEVFANDLDWIMGEG